MITVDEGSFFAIIVTAAVAAVTVVVLPRRLAPPVVVIELLLGIVIGPQVLGIADSDEFIDFFSNLGLGMLFFFAGYEIDFERIKGKPLTLGAWGWLLSLVLAYGIGGALAAAGIVVSFLYTGSAMATTAIGTLIPILRDGGELQTRFGNYLLGGGRHRRVRPDPADHALPVDHPAAARGGDPGRLHRHRPAAGAHLGTARLARAAGARADPGGEQPARRPDRDGARLRPGRCWRPSSGSTCCWAASSPG